MDLSFMQPGSPNTGEWGLGDVAELQKALTADYGTDVATLQGGGALRIQSLDMTMQATIAENKDFVLFNKLEKQRATATVDEWTEQSAVGGFRGGSTNTETGAIASATGTYNRRVGLVKYLMTQRQVSYVSTIQSAIVEAQAVEYKAGATQLCTDAEHLLFHGDSTVVPTEFDGIYAQIVGGINAGQVESGGVIDAKGGALTSVKLINQAARQIRKSPNFGRPTDLFLSLNTQADMDTALDPAFRVPLPDVPGGGILLGSPVTGIRTSHGPVTNNPDPFIPDEEDLAPFEVIAPNVASNQAAIAPASVTPATASDATSYFDSTWAGNYYYMVAGVNAAGQSTGVVSSQVSVSAAQRVTLTIAKSTGGQETGYAIYRSRLNGGNAVSGVVGINSEFRLIARIPKAGATTTWIDRNYDLPGTTKAYILNLTRGMTAMTWRQFLPMVKFQLYPTNAAVLPWAQLLFGYLRLSKMRQHVVIKNIVPNAAVWRPKNDAAG